MKNEFEARDHLQVLPSTEYFTAKREDGIFLGRTLSGNWCYTSAPNQAARLTVAALLDAFLTVIPDGEWAMWNVELPGEAPPAMLNDSAPGAATPEGGRAADFAASAAPDES